MKWWKNLLGGRGLRPMDTASMLPWCVNCSRPVSFLHVAHCKTQLRACCRLDYVLMTSPPQTPVSALSEALCVENTVQTLSYQRIHSNIKTMDATLFVIQKNIRVTDA